MIFKRSILAGLVCLCLLLTGAGFAQDPKQMYDQAKADYRWLVETPDAKSVYHNWQSLAERFSRIYTMDPNGELAAPSLYWMARIHAGAYQQFQRQSDFDSAVDIYQRLISHFPNSYLADDAQFLIGQLHEQKADLKHAYLEYLKVTTNHPKGDMVGPAKKRLDALEKELTSRPRPAADEPAPKTKTAAETAGGGGEAGIKAAKYDQALAAVTDLRHWSTPSYTRVVMSLERPVPYTTNLLKKDPDAQKPRRLYLDLKGARLTGKVKDPVTIGDGLLVRARTGQFNPDTVRLVLDIKKLASYKVFTLDNPFRVVVDCFGPNPKATKVIRAKKKAQKVPRGKAKEMPPEVGLAAALGLKLKRVVLDPGHGGKDPGAVWKGLKEKDLTLDIAQRTAKKLREKLGCEVLLTRNRDKFLPLEDRTAFANTHDADLFVSLHVNAAPGKSLNGLETYFLNLASDEQSMRVAARENATTERSISDLQVILNDLMLNSKINESNRMARVVHKNALVKLRKHYKVRDLGVRQAPFYVLIGARMPSVLIETGFITNPTEHKRLASKAYKERMAEGIADGIVAYAKQLDTASR